MSRRPAPAFFSLCVGKQKVLLSAGWQISGFKAFIFLLGRHYLRLKITPADPLIGLFKRRFLKSALRCFGGAPVNKQLFACCWMHSRGNHHWANDDSPLQLFTASVGANHHSPGRDRAAALVEGIVDKWERGLSACVNLFECLRSALTWRMSCMALIFNNRNSLPVEATSVANAEAGFGRNCCCKGCGVTC